MLVPGRYTEIDPGDLTVTYTGGGNSSYDVGCARCKAEISSDEDFCYFELKVLSGGHGNANAIGIGMCDETLSDVVAVILIIFLLIFAFFFCSPMNRMPGW